MLESTRRGAGRIGMSEPHFPRRGWHVVLIIWHRCMCLAFIMRSSEGSGLVCFANTPFKVKSANRSRSAHHNLEKCVQSQHSPFALRFRPKGMELMRTCRTAGRKLPAARVRRHQCCFIFVTVPFNAGGDGAIVAGTPARQAVVCGLDARVPRRPGRVRRCERGVAPDVAAGGLCEPR